MLRRFPYLRTLATVCIVSLTVQVAAPLFASSSMRGVERTVSSLSTDNNPSSSKRLAWANGLWNLILSNLQSGAPPLNPAPGSPQPWQPTYPVCSGVVNMATGNLQIVHPVCGWGGKGGGIAFTLYFNSQSTRTSPLGNKWTHSYNWQVVTGTNTATVIAGDGTETTFSLSGGQYLPPAGVYDQLVRHGDGTWTLTHKGGLQRLFTAEGKLDRVVDLNGNVVQCAYSGGLLTSVTDASGRVLQLGYSGGRLTSVTDAEGRVWTLSYDATGHLIAVSDPLLNGVSYSTQFGYSGDNVTTITNRLGKTWTFAYGASNRFSSMTDPDGKTWTLAYQVPGGGLGGFRTQPIAIGIEPGDVVSVGVTTDPTGIAERRGMNDLGEWRTFTDALGNQTQLEYDSAHNRIKVRLPSGAVWQYTYDARGNTLTVKDPLNNTTSYQYGLYDRVTLVQDPLGNQTHYGYDSRGNLVQVTDPLGNTTTYTVNGSGLVTAVTDPMGRQTQFTYDATGNLTQVRDPLGNTTRYSYQCCRVTQRTDALGRVTTYSYDGWGRLVGIDYPQSADVSLQYDAEGRWIQSVDGTGTRTFSYDSWGRRVQQVSPAGTTTATYDGAGRLASQTDVTGRRITYSYDGAGRLVRVSDPTSWVQYTYNANSAVTREVYSNNTRVDYTYDSAGRVTSVQHRVHSTGALIIGYAVTYDSAGRVTRINETPSNAVTTYQYDGAGRLLREERTVNRPYLGEYQYDASGNRTFARRVENGVETHRGTYTYDGAGRLVQVVDAATNATETYVWNADGTLASFPGPGYTRLLEYDEEGRLIRIRRDYGGGNVQLAYEYAYGFDGGRRWRKDYLNGVWTRYPCGVACGAGELVEQQKPLEGGSWSTSALYLQGISLVRRNSEWHHFDPLGTAGVITNMSASVVSNNLYDVFGVLRYQQGSAETPWRWWLQGAEEYYLYIAGMGIVYNSKHTSSSLLRYYSTTATFRHRPARLPKFPKLNPACLGCLLGVPLFIPYFADCSRPWTPGWRDCINTYWDAFHEECTSDVFCKAAIAGCLFACGLDAPDVVKWLRRVLKVIGASPSEH